MPPPGRATYNLGSINKRIEANYRAICCLKEQEAGVIVSADADNDITAGSDGGAYIDLGDPVAVVSADADNDIVAGSDGGAYIDLSTALTIVSADADNSIVAGSDGGAYLDVSGLGGVSIGAEFEIGRSNNAGDDFLYGGLSYNTDDLIIDGGMAIGDGAATPNIFVSSTAPSAPAGLTTGVGNIGIGEGSLSGLTSGNDNVVVGISGASAVGAFTQNAVVGNYALLTGAQNAVLGFEAAGSAGTFRSVAIGYEALYDANNNDHIAIGYQALANFLGLSFSLGIGYQAGRASTGAECMYIGKEAGETNSGDNNTYFGFESAVVATSGANNTTLGHSAGISLSTGGTNTLIGVNAGDSINSGSGHVHIGYAAGAAMTTQFGSVHIGTEAGNQNTDGDCVSIGYRSLFKNSGSSNVAIGTFAFYNFSSTRTGTSSVAIGRSAGSAASSGSELTLIGRNAGGSDNVGSGCTFLGAFAGNDATSAATNNTYIGTRAGENNANGDGNVYLGYAVGQNDTASDRLMVHNADSQVPLIWGDFATPQVKVHGTHSVANPTEGGAAAFNIRAVRELHALAAAATSDTTLNIPSGALLLGASFNVDTAVTTSGGDNTWEAAYNGGSTTNLAPASTSGALDTKVDNLIVPEKAGAATEIRFTAGNGEDFSGGVIEIVTYYLDLSSLANA